MIFRRVYVENKELKEEIEFYSRELWEKEKRIRQYKKQIKELEKELEEIKNEENTKGKNTRLPKDK